MYIVLTACFYGDALKFTKKASLNMETIDLKVKGCASTDNYQLSLSRFYRLLSTNKISNHHSHTLKYVNPGWNVNGNDFFGILSLTSSLLLSFTIALKSNFLARQINRNA